jgi:glycosyltransferase involved in cell wall biosynthesis
MEKWAVKTADKVILVTEWSRQAFLNRYSREPRNKFILIPNGCDLEEFSGVECRHNQVHSKFTILHAGSLNVSKFWGRDPSGLFDAMHNLLCQNPELAEKFNLVFAGDLPEEYLRAAKEKGISRMIRVLGHLPHREVLRLMKSADVLLAINYDGWSTLIPAKVYEYWAVGGPPILLLSCPGAAEMFVREHHLGFTADPSDARGIAQALMEIYRQSETISPIRVNTNGIEMYDRRGLTRELVQVLSMVCK